MPPTPRLAASTSTGARSSAPSLISRTARSTVANEPFHAGENGAVSGRQRKHGRLAAAANFAVQISGVMLLIFCSGSLGLALGCVLFGLGSGNLTSLPPLIVQKEFEREDVATAVAPIIAINQGVFAFAPAIIGAMRDTTADYQLPFALIALIQLLAAVIILLGRRSARTPATPL